MTELFSINGNPVLAREGGGGIMIAWVEAGTRSAVGRPLLTEVRASENLDAHGLPAQQRAGPAKSKKSGWPKSRNGKHYGGKARGRGKGLLGNGSHDRESN